MRVVHLAPMALLVGLSSCAGILGFEDGKPYPDASLPSAEAGDAGDGGSLVETGGSSGADATGADAPREAPAPELDASQTADSSAELPEAARPEAGILEASGPPSVDAEPRTDAGDARAEAGLGEAGGPLFPDGTPCTMAEQCQAGKCAPAWIDADGDGYGDKFASPPRSFCGGAPPHYVSNGLDCCDKDGDTHPGQTAFSRTANTCGKFDWNCDGVEELEFANHLMCVYDAGVQGGWQSTIPGCGEMADWIEAAGTCSSATVSMAWQYCR